MWRPEDDGHYDQILTRFSLAYKILPGDYVAGLAAPTIPVEEKSGKYRTFTKDSFIGMGHSTERPYGGEPVDIDMDTSTADYSVTEYAKRGRLDDRERKNATGWDPEAAKVEQLPEYMMQDREALWAATFFGSSIWDIDRSGDSDATPTAPAFTSWNAAAGVPIDLITTDKRTIKKNTGVEPNMLICGMTAWDVLRMNAQMLSTYSVGQGGFQGRLTRQMAAEVLELSKGVHVAKAIKRTSQREATVTTDFIVGDDDALLIYVPDTPSPFSISGGLTFAWTGLLGGNAFETMGVWRGRWEDRWTDWFAVRTAFGFATPSTAVGAFYSDVDAA